MKILFNRVAWLFLIIALLAGCKKKSSSPSGPTAPEIPDGDYHAPKAAEAPVINGIGDESCWQNAAWASIDHLWLGQAATPSDFSGRYKIVWTTEKLYFLVEITDEKLSDTHADPLQDYYNDDCLEIFLDENHSGGNHQNNFNAFAYHIALDGRAVDMSASGAPREYTRHIQISRTSNGTVHTWEVAITVYTDAYSDASQSNPTAVLAAGKDLGFAIAYCDADNSGAREHFYGSIDIPGSNKNVAWQNASVLGELLLQ